MLGWFRRHATVLMVVLGSAAMVIFGLGPVFDRLSQGGGGQGYENPTLATWKGGSLTEVELETLRVRHYDVQRFLKEVQEQAAKKLDTYRPLAMPVQPLSNTELTGDIMNRVMLAEKAKQEGFVASDAMVKSYISMVSADAQFSENELEAMNRKVNSNTPFLVVKEHLKTELLAMQMLEFLYDSFRMPVPNVTEGMQLYFRTHEQIECQVLPIQVSEFLSKVTTEPSASEIKRLYEEGKSDLALPTAERPGFKIPNRANVRYFKADFETFLQNAINEITDEEVQQEYERLVEAKHFIVMEPVANDNSFSIGTPPPTGTDKTPQGDQGDQPEGPPGDSTEPAPSDVDAPPTDPEMTQPGAAEGKSGTAEGKAADKPPAEKTEAGQEKPAGEKQPEKAQSESNQKSSTADPEAAGKAEAGKAEAGKAEAGKAEAGKAEAGKAEAGKAEAGKAEAGKAEAGKAEAGKAEAGKAEAGKAEAGKADAGKAEAGKAEAGKAEAGKAEAGKAEAGKETTGGQESAAEKPGKGDDQSRSENWNSIYNSIVSVLSFPDSTSLISLQEPDEKPENTKPEAQQEEPETKQSGADESVKSDQEPAKAGTEQAEVPAPPKEVAPPTLPGGLGEMLQLEDQLPTKPEQEQKVKPLKDVAEDVKRMMAQQPARKAMEEAVTKASVEVGTYMAGLMEQEIDSSAPAPEPLDIEAIAERYNLDSQETGLVDFFEFRNSDLGGLPGMNVAQQVFSQFDNKRLFEPEVIQAGLPAPNMYAYWFEEKQDSKIPSLKDCRQQIIDYWKRQEAKKLALAEANSIAEKVNRAEGKNLKDLYPEEAVDTGAFTWFNSQSRQISQPFGVTDPTNGFMEADDEFMQVAFSLDKGSAGVASGLTNDRVYVIENLTGTRSMEEVGREYLENQFGPFQGATPTISSAASFYKSQAIGEVTEQLRDDLGFKSND